MGVVAAVLIGIAILLAVALVLGLTDRGLSEEPVDHPDLGLPDRPLRADDVGRLRFRVGLRGYRMDDVDAALDRLAAALQEAERRADEQRAPGGQEAEARDGTA